MSTPIEHNEPVKATAPEQMGTAAGAKLGAEYAANMNAPKVESAGPGAADKHLTNFQLIDAQGNELAKNKAASEHSMPASGHKTVIAEEGHGDKVGTSGTPIAGPSPAKHLDFDSNSHKVGWAGAVATGAVVGEALLLTGLGPVGAVGAAALAGGAVYEAITHR